MRIQIELPHESDLFKLFHQVDLLFSQLKTEAYFDAGKPGAKFINTFDTQHYTAIAPAFRENRQHQSVALAPTSLCLFLEVINQISTALISTKIIDGESADWLAQIDEPQRKQFLNAASNVSKKLKTQMYLLVQNITEAKVA